VALGLLALAVAAGRAALRRDAIPERMQEYDVAPPRRPFLIMNPRSGGGKVTRFGLKDKAEALGATVALLEGPQVVDVGELARRAVADGADLLGVAGGDGTQALVAGIAAEHDIPLLVISAGTRNYFALDLGLDREDPARCLDALRDGVELRVDLGFSDGRPFVNNASFGAYAAVVQSPAYREDKTGTTLDLLPELLAGQQGPRLVATAGTVTSTGRRRCWSPTTSTGWATSPGWGAGPGWTGAGWVCSRSRSPARCRRSGCWRAPACVG
jgi:Diacylglycerol kinase catalytic domain